MHARERRRTWERTQRRHTDVRRLYSSARWRRLRQQVLAQSPVCSDCQTAGRMRASVEVHHVEKHDGDFSKFWAGPFAGLCAPCHAKRTRQGE
jgi:hypothetical protein